LLNPPTNVNTVVGSTVNLTCGFQTTTNTSIARFHWLYDGRDIVDYKTAHNLNVTNVPRGINYIQSTLIIYLVQADYAGNYSCYCSYDKTKLDVDDPGAIQSDIKSANLNVSDKHDMKTFYIVGTAVILGVIIFLLVFGAVIIRIRRRKYNYQELSSSDTFTG